MSSGVGRLLIFGFFLLSSPRFLPSCTSRPLLLPPFFLFLFRFFFFLMLSIVLAGGALSTQHTSRIPTRFAASYPHAPGRTCATAPLRLAWSPLCAPLFLNT